MRSVFLIAAVGLAPAVAEAHIHLTSPQARTDSTTGDQKAQHCGVANQVRTNRITTFAPGQTITVTWIEPIQHPGWFRIAFQPNGDIFGIPPVSNGPAGNGGPSNFPTEDRTGLTDPDNASIVLKDRIPDGTLSTEVTLPNMECTTCTLQFIQVMTDKAPYTTDINSDDIYFNCADIVLAANAPDAGMQPTPDAGTGGGGGGGGNNPDSEITGGCAATGAGGLPLALLALGAIRARRRR